MLEPKRRNASQRKPKRMVEASTSESERERGNRRMRETNGRKKLAYGIYEQQLQHQYQHTLMATATTTNTLSRRSTCNPWLSGRRERECSSTTQT